MHKIYFKYQPVLINAIIFLALVAAMILNEGTTKDFFAGLATGAAFINFGYSISKIREKKAEECDARLTGRAGNDVE